MESSTTATATAMASGVREKSSSSSKKQSRRGGSDGYMGVAIHSQVMKIKQEIEKIKQPSLEQLQIRHVSLGNFSRQRSRSPLGLANRPIPVGNA